MKHKSLIFVPLVEVLLLLIVSSVAAEVPPVVTAKVYNTPSTNYENSTKGWAYFDVLSTGAGTTTVSFTSTRNFASCFEYRTDGATSQVISENGGVNYNTVITDGLYPYVCANNSTKTLTIPAIAYVEIRMVFGAERDERFNSTRFDLSSPPSTCRIDAPASVDEGTSFTAAVLCEDVDGVYGFQLGTSYTGEVTHNADSYTYGTFVTDVEADEFLVGNNARDNYSVSRSNGAPAASGDFSLGSLDYTATLGLNANKSAVLTLNPLLLGNKWGAPLGVVISSPTTVTIRDLLTLNLKVESDGSVTQVRDVTASVDSETRTQAIGPATGVTLHFTDVIGTPTPLLTADMTSHLECSGTLNLTTSVTSKLIHLKAGDVEWVGSETPTIDLSDSLAIGLVFGATTTAEEDVNGDGTVNVFDLIHVGRNYGAVRGVCS